ncbi:MAG: hydantoinase/carbamoylase family amidase, partial [Halarsenatibacteraceae bacterium]
GRAGAARARLAFGHHRLYRPFRAAGWPAEDLAAARRDLAGIKAFIEIHIEQGTVLESENIPIGIVNGIAGITRYKVNLFGEANHSGTTPMKLRKDALVAAAKLILEIEDIALELGEPFVATVGTLDIKPGAVNVIPGEVELIIELRDLDQNKIEVAGERIIAAADQMNGDIRVERIVNKTPVDTDFEIAKIIEEACKRLKIPGRRILSGAGHDAKEIARKVPTGMIFVPSIAGKSHCPEENTNWEDIYLGTEVLLETILSI